MLRKMGRIRDCHVRCVGPQIKSEEPSELISSLYAFRSPLFQQYSGQLMVPVYPPVNSSAPRNARHPDHNRMTQRLAAELTADDLSRTLAA